MNPLRNISAMNRHPSEVLSVFTLKVFPVGCAAVHPPLHLVFHFLVAANEVARESVTGVNVVDSIHVDQPIATVTVDWSPLRVYLVSGVGLFRVGDDGHHGMVAAVCLNPFHLT